jgi:DNA-binding CsgD family transcriptional regulator
MTTLSQSNIRHDLSCDDQVALSQEMEAIIYPLLAKLNAYSSELLQTTRQINLLETNLQHLLAAYRKGGNLAATYQRLSPVERIVAAMSRHGASTSDIATTLTLTPKKVSSHQKHILKKLGISGKAVSLQSYLQLLS